MVSKPEHCQVHARALEGEGHTVKILGSAGNIEFPPTLEIIVVRIASCSHGASEVAFAHAKKHNLPLVVKDGLTAIRNEVAKIAKRKAPTNPMWVMAPQKQEPLVLMASTPGSGPHSVGARLNTLVTTPEVVKRTPEQLKAANQALLLGAFKKAEDPNSEKIGNHVKALLAEYVNTPARMITYAQKLFSENNLPLPKWGAFDKVYQELAGKPILDRVVGPVYKAATYLHSLSKDQISLLLEGFIGFDDTLDEKELRKGPKLPFSGMPGPFTAFYMMIVPEGTVIMRRTFIKSYTYLTEGRQLDPRIFMDLKASFAFLTESPKGGVATTTASVPDLQVEEPMVVAPAPQPPKDLNEDIQAAVDSKVLASIQEEILSAGVRTENLEKEIAKRFVTVDGDFKEVRESLAHVSDARKALSVVLAEGLAAQELELKNLRNLVKEMGVLNQSQSERISLLQAQVEELDRGLSVALANKAESIPAMAPADPVMDFLTKMSVLGATVNISIPPKT